MKPIQVRLGEAVNFYNGAEASFFDDGEYIVYGSNGSIGKSRNFNNERAIIMGRVGAYCGSIEIEKNKFWASDNTIVVNPKNNYNLEYLYYLLINFPLRNFAGGAAQPLLTHAILRVINLKLFVDHKYQEKIASILSAYDDLIIVNRRRIQLLEEAARLLFREWFVYFRFPGHEKAKIVEGVPEGWTSEKLRNIVTFIGGHAFKSNSYQQEGRYGIVTIKNVQQGNFISECTDYLDETPNGMKKHCFLSNGDILISLTGNVGRVCLVFGTDYLLNQRVAKVESKNNTPKSFIYWMFDNSIMQKRIENLSYGSAQQNLSPIKLGEQEVVFPPKPLLKAFDGIASLINTEIIQLLIQNQKLAQARDLLLPRLMSGAIDPVRYDKLSNGVKV